MGKIIAFSGKATSGKTTAARIIQDRLGGTEKVSIVSFAQILKHKAIEDFGDFFNPDDLYNNKGRVIDIDGRTTTIRQLLIDIGQLYRKIDARFWLRKGIGLAKAASTEGKTAIIDDMRFPNEYHALREMGVILVRLDRDVPLIDDESEWGLDSFKFDCRINNNGTIKELEDNLEEVLRLAY
jgi:hypothetical protein